MRKFKPLNRLVLKVNEERANVINGLIIDSSWGHEGKHMTHCGEIVENATDLDLNIGDTVWFDYRLKWEKDKFEPSFFGEKEGKGVFYYFLTKQTFQDIVRCSNSGAENGYIGFHRPPKETVTKGGIILPQTAEQVDDRGVVVMGNDTLKKGDEIIFAQDNTYPSEDKEGDWVEEDGKRVIFTQEKDIFCIVRDGNLIPYGGWVIMEALDDSHEWTKRKDGLFLPQKEQVTKGLGVVHCSNVYDKGVELIYAKRGYNSFLFNDNKYYAVSEHNVFASV